MDLRKQRSFLSLAEHLHFGRAAAALGTAQPSLSLQIRQLEDELGVQLFERASRNVRLTNAGDVYREEIRRVFDALDAAVDHTRAADAGRRGTLTVGASITTMLSHLPAIVHAFAQTHPDVQLRMDVMQGAGIIAALHARTIQLGFVRAPFQDTGLSATPLWKHPYRLVLSRRHTLATEPAVALRDLGDETLLVYAHTSSQGIHDDIMAICYAQRFTPHRIEHVTEIETAIGLAACGLGVAIVPKPWEKLALPEAVFVPIAGDTLLLQTSACRHADERSALVAAMISVARTAAA